MEKPAQSALEEAANNPGRGRPLGAATAKVLDPKTGLMRTPPAEQWQPTVYQPLHEALAELVIANPGATAKELGHKLQRSPVTIRLLLRSDMVRELISKKREKFVDPRMTQAMDDLFDVALATSVEMMVNKVEETGSFELAKQTIETIGPMSRYGAKAAVPQLQANFIVPMPAKAASTEAWEASVTEVLRGRDQSTPDK